MSALTLLPSLVQAAAQGGESAVGTKAEELVLHLLAQFIAILAATRLVVYVARKLGQTNVAGEILAGLVLGPSVLGALAPGLMNTLFDGSTSQTFVALSQIGLVLLMFQIGLEFEFKANLGTSKKSIVVVSLAGLMLPFAMGYLSAPWFHERLAEPRPSLFGFQLFFGIAMSITAIPILGRIFMELGLSHTRIAALSIGAAAIDDIAGWLILGVVTLLVQHQFATSTLLFRMGSLAAYVAFVLLVARPLLKRFVGNHLRRQGGLETSAVALMLLAVFASASITSLIGVFAIIGGFVIGVALHDDRRFVEEWKTRVSPLVNTFFLPIFFTYTGLRTSIGALSSVNEVITCLLVVAVAFVSKFGGAYAGARFVGENHRSAMVLGVCMNTRALMELIALNVGYDLGVLPRSMFTMLVIMAILSTFIATPLIRWLLRGEERHTPSLPLNEEPLPRGT
ncbi:cation:proton antiporter [Melittangium boletus]|uniref:Sodium:proton antiporter n=1 Tax=Melittangium boletus DSM 14713 TaxID=1294270 RepID=A0A250IAS3_9BACT|nr:cation:proton antiporter [Melittangium boletus]ATB28237.1 sodium:proton antiporter [Melittangium boletus DSM 14713]